MKKIWMPLLALLFVLVACSEEETDTGSEERITPVEVGEVSQGDLVIEKNLYGRSTPEKTTAVMTPMVGEVDSLEVTNGEQVEKDDPIMTIIGAETGRSFEIVATADGEVTSLRATEGDMISTSDPVAIIAELSHLKVQVDVTAANLALFQGKEEVAIQFSGDEESTVATVKNVPALPNETGLFPVELLVENTGDKWSVGMVAVVTVSEKTITDTLLIPTTALIEEEEEAYVYLVEGDKVTKKVVTVTEMKTDVTAIEADLKAGDQLVISGQLTLTDGSKISIAKEESES